MIVRACLGFGLALASSACSSSTVILEVPSLPDEIDFVAALLLDTTDNLVASTPLLVRDEAVRFETSESVDQSAIARQLIVGYRDQDLAPLIPAGVSIDRAPLELAEVGGPRLPVPAFTASSEPGAALEPGEPAPALTVSWLESCPSSEGLILVNDCFQEFCETALASHGQCGLRFDIDPCSFESPEFSVDSAGRLTPTSFGSFDTCDAAVDLEGAVYSAECTGTSPTHCGFWAIPPQDTTFAVKQRVRVGPDVAPIGDSTNIEDAQSLSYLHGLAEVGGQILVARSQDVWKRQCFQVAPNTFHFVDPMTLVETRSSTAPPCISHIIADDRGGFVAVWADSNMPRRPVLFSRFDSMGRQIETLDLSGEVAVVSQPTVLDLIFLSERNAWVLVVTDWHRADPGVIVLVSNDSFDVIWTSPPIGEDLVGAAAIDQDMLMLAGDEFDTLYPVDLASRRLLERIRLRGLCATNRMTLSGISYVDSQLWVTTTSNVVLSLDSKGTSCRVRPSFETDATFFELAELPDGRVAIGAADRIELSAQLMTLDPARPYFSPGLLELGVGPPRDLLVRPDGSIIVSLTWISELVRVGASD